MNITGMYYLLHVRKSAMNNSGMFTNEEQLVVAVEHFNQPWVSHLLKMGANPMAMGAQALCTACKVGNIRAVRAILPHFRLDRVVSCVTKPVQDQTPLWLACANQHRDVVEELLEAGFPVVARNSADGTILHHTRQPIVEACRHTGWETIVASMITRIEGVWMDLTPALMTTVTANNIKCMREILVYKNTHINAKQLVGVFKMACRACTAPCMQELLRAYPDMVLDSSFWGACREKYTLDVLRELQPPINMLDCAMAAAAENNVDILLHIWDLSDLQMCDQILIMRHALRNNNVAAFIAIARPHCAMGGSDQCLSEALYAIYPGMETRRDLVLKVCECLKPHTVSVRNLMGGARLGRDILSRLLELGGGEHIAVEDVMERSGVLCCDERAAESLDLLLEMVADAVTPEHVSELMFKGCTYRVRPVIETLCTRFGARPTVRDVQQAITVGADAAFLTYLAEKSEGAVGLTVTAMSVQAMYACERSAASPQIWNVTCAISDRGGPNHQSCATEQ